MECRNGVKTNDLFFIFCSFNIQLLKEYRVNFNQDFDL